MYRTLSIILIIVLSSSYSFGQKTNSQSDNKTYYNVDIDEQIKDLQRMEKAGKSRCEKLEELAASNYLILPSCLGLGITGIALWEKPTKYGTKLTQGQFILLGGFGLFTLGIIFATISINCINKQNNPDNPKISKLTRLDISLNVIINKDIYNIRVSHAF